MKFETQNYRTAMTAIREEVERERREKIAEARKQEPIHDYMNRTRETSADRAERVEGEITQKIVESAPRQQQETAHKAAQLFNTNRMSRRQGDEVQTVCTCSFTWHTQKVQDPSKKLPAYN
jgi:hypothetical protein